jgi:DNA-binding transcriptional ArsR family regulator
MLMALIHFTILDISRTRVLTSPLSLTEALLALDLFDDPGRGGPAFATWRRQVQRRSAIAALPTLTRPRRPLADMYRLLFRATDSPPPDDETVSPPIQTADEAEEIRQVVHQFSAVALAPYWRRIAERLATDRDARARVMLAGGVEKLLATLHPEIRWAPPVLHVACHNSQEVHLGGRGLRLAPSLFLHGRPGVLIDNGAGDAPILLYPALGEPDTVETLWRSEAPRPRALGALIGQTRAAALRELTASRTTGELGQRLGVSSAAVSQHTTVMRDAGLITTKRLRNIAIHSLTPLGSALLYVTGGSERPMEIA